VPGRGQKTLYIIGGWLHMLSICWARSHARQSCKENRRWSSQKVKLEATQDRPSTERTARNLQSLGELGLLLACP
jgi:hypothetical protein